MSRGCSHALVPYVPEPASYARCHLITHQTVTLPLKRNAISAFQVALRSYESCQTRPHKSVILWF